MLRVLSFFGLASDLREPPQHVLDANRIRDGHADIGMFEAKLAKAAAQLQDARDRTSAYYEQRKRAVDELVEAARQGALRIAKISAKAAVDL
jgi:SpoVK/Ycf46/Vps4 family AAA+-type ATPase